MHILRKDQYPVLLIDKVPFSMCCILCVILCEYCDSVMSSKNNSHKAKENGFTASRHLIREVSCVKGSIWYMTLEQSKACPALKDARVACVY